MNTTIRNTMHKMKDVGLDHPTPVHLRTCVLDALTAESEARGEPLPFWVASAVIKGVRTCCAEHDAARIPGVM